MRLQSLALGHAILQQHSRYADGIDPITNLGPLEVHRENGVAAARKNEHRRAGSLVGGRTIDTDRWLRHIAQAYERRRCQGEQLCRHDVHPICG